MKQSTNLFIVDDDADDRRLFIEAVKEVGEDIECTSAVNGEEALEILKDPANTLPDYIFLDIRMPRVNGKQCLLEIKKDDRLKHIPVVIFTTSRDVEESKELREMGAYHFISKPTDPDEIFYLVSFILAFPHS
ncbi:MAG: response regulator [Chitinophagaceae bacterium]|nr:response regulator [Chitinophagaceae bacterium]